MFRYTYHYVLSTLCTTGISAIAGLGLRVSLSRVEVRRSFLKSKSSQSLPPFGDIHVDKAHNFTLILIYLLVPCRFRSRGGVSVVVRVACDHGLCLSLGGKQQHGS